MKVVFRADASLLMGSGHVMRCLTLADELTKRGAECAFICREHSGHLGDLIASRGYAVHLLSMGASGAKDGHETAHAEWLGATQLEDKQYCLPILRDLHPDWLVVDNYALDHHWSRGMSHTYGRLMVIDDLVDREHQCDLLLDQNLGRKPDDYRHLVNMDCSILAGANFALLRPEFAICRTESLERRKTELPRKLLITMGGVDVPNASSRILRALSFTKLPRECEINVVLGATCPWVSEVKQAARELQWPTNILVGVRDMARLMAESDLAIGASGSTSWERCCLGLPSITLVLAENQRFIATQLAQYGAAELLSLSLNLPEELASLIEEYFNPKRLRQMSAMAASICDGLGAQRVGDVMYE